MCLLVQIVFSLSFHFLRFKRLSLPEDKLIGNVSLSNGSVTMKILAEKIGGKDYVYLGYQNQEYKSITDIKSVIFAATEEDLDGLFSVLKDIIKTDKDQEIKLGTDYMLSASKFSNSSIWMSFYKGSRSDKVHEWFTK